MLVLSNGQQQICDAIISEKEIYDALRSMENDKKPGSDELSKEFYEVFLDDAKNPLLASNNAFIKEKHSTSQKHAVIKLTEEKDRDETFIKI